MAIGGSDSALQTQLKNLYTSNLDPNIVKNTPQKITDFTGLVSDWAGTPSEPMQTYRKPVSPYIDAVYDDSGRLTGYEGNNNAYLTDNSYVHGSFDPSGKANPVYQTKSAGGFFQGQLPAMASLVAGAYFGLPTANSATAISAENPFLSGMAGENAISGAGVAGSTGGTYGAGVAGAANAAPFVNPTNITTPISQIGSTTGTPYTGPSAGSLAADNIDVGGGFNPATGTGDAATAAAAAATGVTPSAAIPYGATNTAGQTVGFTNPAAAAAAKTGLSDLLTPSNVLIGKAVLDAVGGTKTVDAIKNSAATQQAAADASRNDLLGLYTAQQGYQRPYMATGTNALGTLGSLGTGTYQMYDEKGNPTGTGTGSGYLQHQFDASDLAKGLAPNYDFMLQQGQMANQRAANMAGGGFGGNALQGLNRYTQDYAGNAYQNAFTNYQTQRQNIFGDLTKLADIGQGATNQLAKSSDAYGTNLTNLNVGNAAAQAAAQVAAAQQGGTNLSNLGNTAVVASLLNQNPGIAKVNLNV
jgi:hypothetical protein